MRIRYNETVRYLEIAIPIRARNDALNWLHHEAEAGTFVSCFTQGPLRISQRRVSLKIFTITFVISEARANDTLTYIRGLAERYPTHESTYGSFGLPDEHNILPYGKEG